MASGLLSQERIDQIVAQLAVGHPNDAVDLRGHLLALSQKPANLFPLLMREAVEAMALNASSETATQQSLHELEAKIEGLSKALASIAQTEQQKADTERVREDRRLKWFQAAGAWIANSRLLMALSGAIVYWLLGRLGVAVDKMPPLFSP